MRFADSLAIVGHLHTVDHKSRAEPACSDKYMDTPTKTSMQATSTTVTSLEMNMGYLPVSGKTMPVNIVICNENTWS